MNTNTTIRNKIILFLVGFFLVLLFPSVSFGAVLRPQYVSDTISDGTPGALANHEIVFQVNQAIDASGKISIIPETNGVLIPLDFNILDIDFAIAVSSTSPYIEKSIADFASVTDVGVAIQTGFSGSLTFTLPSSLSLFSGNRVRIRLGTNATVGATGINRLVNSDIVGAKKISIETRNATDSLIDSGGTVIFIIDSVFVGPGDTTDRTPPVIYNVTPTGLLPGTTRATEVSLYTDEFSKCRYATTSGKDFNIMTGVFPKSIPSPFPAYLHYDLILRNLVTSTTYDLYVRCRDFQLNRNMVDYRVEFTIGVVPVAGVNGAGTTGNGGTGAGVGSGSGGGSGNSVGSGSSGGGGGGVGNPGGGNFLKSASILISGTAYPSSRIFILLDGKEKATIPAGTGGNFSTKLEGVERGTYTLGMYAIDTKGVRSSMVSSAVSVLPGSNNTVMGVLFPPTISAENKTVNPDEDITLFGMALPNSMIEMYIGSPNTKFVEDSFVATSTTDNNGIWTGKVKTKSLAVGNYVIVARAVVSPTESSGMSAKLPVGVGKEATVDFAKRANLNGDEKVNLVDFSILLFQWGSDDPTADINLNGKVDLPDFSIMIFYWTG